MRDLSRRTVTAAIYAVAVLIAIAAPAGFFFALLAGAGILGLLELRKLQGAARWNMLTTMFFLGLVALGTLRVAGALGARASTPPDAPGWLLLALAPTWAADVFAYVVGSAIGRRRLAPRVSPGKTWEGTIAGFIAASIAAVAIAIVFGLPRLPATIIALGVGPVGLAGDLLESSVKRSVGVKDSGTILPGHGGVLDRLDSLTASAIFALLVLAAWSATTLGSEGGMFDRY